MHNIERVCFLEFKNIISDDEIKYSTFHLCSKFEININGSDIGLYLDQSIVRLYQIH